MIFVEDSLSFMLACDTDWTFLEGDYQFHTRANAKHEAPAFTLLPENELSTIQHASFFTNQGSPSTQMVELRLRV